jgi:hypothetical protein
MGTCGSSISSPLLMGIPSASTVIGLFHYRLEKPQIRKKRQRKKRKQKKRKKGEMVHFH